MEWILFKLACPLNSNYKYIPTCDLFPPPMGVSEVRLVRLRPNLARRDKPWNYIPFEIGRYTKHL